MTPAISLAIIGYLFLCSYFLHVKLSRILETYGERRSVFNKSIEKQVHETTVSFREFFVSGKLAGQKDKFSFTRADSTNVTWKIFWINSIPKYAFEMIFVFGLTFLAFIEIKIFKDPNSLTILLTFLFAGSRIMPSLLRIQASTNTIRMSYGASHSLRTLELNLNSVPFNKEIKRSAVKNHLNEISIVSCSGLLFRYDPNSSVSIEIPKLNLASGERIGLVGRSGSGKSTLADLLMGVLNPISGSVLISGYSPQSYISKFPGKIGYVPQSSNLFDGSIAENIAIGIPANEIDASRLRDVLNLVDLMDFVNHLPEGFFSLVGERGTRLSGGQRQRIALARALYSKPAFLILDEATSSLDAESEDFVSKSISNLDDDVTVLVIAHRISTIKNLSRILYLHDGSIVADGSFEEVKRLIPEFKRQTELSGL
jgi:ABC-type multidrug transport system fused ATPase/permease subunit